jgi:hypothetical protein
VCCGVCSRRSALSSTLSSASEGRHTHSATTRPDRATAEAVASTPAHLLPYFSPWHHRQPGWTLLKCSSTHRPKAPMPVIVIYHFCARYVQFCNVTFIFKLPQEVSSSASTDSEFWPGFRRPYLGCSLSTKGLSVAPVQIGPQM